MKKNTNKVLDSTFTTTRGADPEFFIKDTDSGDIVSAIDVLVNDKYNPIILGDEVTLYYDNAMGEFTIKPAESKEQFIGVFRDAFTKINNYLKTKCGEKYEIVIQASHEFDPKYLDCEEALRIGCNPEFNADECMQITPPDFSGSLRSAGGHIAVGRTDFKDKIDKDGFALMSFETKLELVKLLDCFVGLPFTLIDNDTTSLRRRKIYGSPSSHRPKDFGIEYRVLSSLWTTSPKTVGLIYDLSELAVQKLISGEGTKILKSIDKEMVNSAIRENNKGLAEEIVTSLNFPKNIMVQLAQYKDVKSWDFYKEWNLSKKAEKALA